MTNFETIVKENSEFVKEVLAHNLSKDTLKLAIEGRRKHYCWFNNSSTGDKPELDFLNAEYKKKVLDNIEKEYLSNIISPFRNKVEYISKEVRIFDQYYIKIKLQDDHICLPYFSKKGGMYKGMDERTRYTLDELGL